MFGSISKIRDRFPTAKLNVYYPFHKLNSEKQIPKNVGYQSGANLAEPQKEQQMTQKIAFRPFRSIQCRILRQSQVRRTFLSAFQAGSPLVRSLFASLTLLVVAMAVPVAVAQKINLSVDVSKPGAKIDRNIFGQFAEHLGHGVYEGIWVGPDSKIPNTRGIRNDVVAALKAMKVPNVRWPGGCFADEYHWRNGIGPQANRNTQSQLGRRNRAEHFRNARVHGLPRPDRRRGLPLRQCWLRHSAGSCGMAGIHDHRSADDAGKRTRCQRASCSVQGCIISASATKAGTAAAT